MKISHRYPVNAAGNDIDRAWLVDQLPTAKRPNALLEIALSPLAVVRIAAQAWLHVDTLIDFVLGDDDLTPYELQCVSGAMDIFNAGDSSEYLAAETLDICDPDGAPSAEARAALIAAKGSDPAAGLVLSLLAVEPLPYAVTYAADVRLDMQNQNIDVGSSYAPRSKRITRRRRQHGTATI